MDRMCSILFATTQYSGNVSYYLTQDQLGWSQTKLQAPNPNTKLRSHWQGDGKQSPAAVHTSRNSEDRPHRQDTDYLTSTCVSMGSPGIVGETQEKTEDRDGWQNSNKRRPDPRMQPKPEKRILRRWKNPQATKNFRKFIMPKDSH